MTKREENYLFNILEYIEDKTRENNNLLKENNKMLKQIIGVLNHYISHANQENEYDFGRNILANMLSNMIELRGLNIKR